MGRLDNTVIFYISDNGLQWGEHRLSSDKAVEFEELIRVPFAMRYPPLISKPYVENHLVGNIDIAPTIYDLAGLPIPSNMDGMSLVKLLKGEPWRDNILIDRGRNAAIGPASAPITSFTSKQKTICRSFIICKPTRSR